MMHQVEFSHRSEGLTTGFYQNMLIAGYTAPATLETMRILRADLQRIYAANPQGFHLLQVLNDPEFRRLPQDVLDAASRLATDFADRRLSSSIVFRREGAIGVALRALVSAINLMSRSAPAKVYKSVADAVHAIAPNAQFAITPDMTNQMIQMIEQAFPPLAKTNL